ncbi:alpha/beta fold hydrolase [Janibacter indicus]|uniref:alpha/beta fold hydrolase n=1 Tax=Janibacter indicus TaxID=857417 RepID=UPI003EBD46BB
MAGWTWEAQVTGMRDRHVLTPDLPGYGRRTDLNWPGAAGAADDIAELIRARGTDGRAHVVGLSLGGLVAVHLLHRHPDLVRTCTISGAAVTGYAWWERVLIGAQVPLWHRRWYWAAQAAAFRIPETPEASSRGPPAARHRRRTGRCSPRSRQAPCPRGPSPTPDPAWPSGASTTLDRCAAPSAPFEPASRSSPRGRRPACTTRGTSRTPSSSPAW